MQNVILIIFVLLIRIISAVVVTTGQPMLILLLSYTTIVLLFKIEYNIMKRIFSKNKKIKVILIIFNLFFAILNTFSIVKFYM